MMLDFCSLLVAFFAVDRSHDLNRAGESGSRTESRDLECDVMVPAFDKAGAKKSYRQPAIGQVANLNHHLLNTLSSKKIQLYYLFALSIHKRFT
jgi:hypothetical protein